MRCVVFLQYSEIESDCFEIFQSQFGNPRISPFEFLLGTAYWSKKQDAGLLTGNAKRIFIFYDNVTCFETNESCRKRSHLPQFFIKAPHFLLAWLLCFSMENPRFYIFLGGDLRNTPDCPDRNSSHFGLENEGCKMSLVFLVWHPPWFFWFSDMVWRLPLLGKYQELCRAGKATHLMSIQPKMQEARERLKKTRSLCVVCGVLAIFRNRKWLLWDLPISVRKSTNIALWVLIRHCLLIEETRRWNAGWQR